MSAVLSPATARISGTAARLFGLMVAFTAAWLAVNLAFPAFQATGAQFVLVRVVLHAVMLTGLWLGLARTDLDRPTRVRVWLAIVVPFTIWLAAMWILAVQGAFRPIPGRPNPAIPLAVVLPLIVALPLLLRARRVAAVLDAAPASWLVGVQLYRVFGGIFLVAWSRGELSGSFALPAGIGDVLVGLLALPVAYLLHVQARGARAAAIAWNILGIVDLVNAVALGILSAPGPLQVIVPDPPNAQLGTFPTVMIPAFAVPSSILLHALSLRQLRRMAVRTDVATR